MRTLLKKTQILSLLLFLLPISVEGQQSLPDHKNQDKGTMTFFLTDSENGYGIPGTISLQGLRESFELKTDNGGNLEFLGEPGKYEISIFANGYDNLSTYFTIEKGKTLNIEVILEKTDRVPVQFKKFSSPTVEGYVIDPETGRPLAGVTVQLIEEGLTVTTDSKGFFSINPSKFSTITKSDDEAVRSNFVFSKNGYMSHVVEHLLMVPDKIKLKIYLKKGQGENIEKYHQNVLDATEKDTEMYENAAPSDNEERFSLNRAVCSTTTSIRVGRNCSCTSCTSVTVMNLQYYSESGLDDEWISSWGIESLKAGSIPYRTYGGYYVNNPVKTNFDIASSTCNQVWGATVYTNAQSAAQATTGKILIKNGSLPVRSEYSAENNYGGTSYNCSNGKAGGSGAYSCHTDNICSGKSPAGHGRGMCQWGSQRWATNSGKSYTWIIDHYYFSTVQYTLCGGPPPPPPAPTSLIVTQIPTCTKGAIFSWTNSASNSTIQVSTSANFSNSSSKTISSGTSTTAPTGFSPAITWQHNQTYYWRIKYSGGSKTGSSFKYKCDKIKPTTSISIPGNWKTGDFTANFTDADEAGGSGLAKSFYQVLYYDGTTWKANHNRGFFGDNFDGTSIDAPWTVKTGTWGISSDNKLEQTNTSEGNTNIYAPLTQNLSNRYLYVWNGKISGAGNNRRAGFHFFCDNASQTERGNSYLVYFRTGGNPDPNNNNKVQIYKASGNTLTLKKSTSYTINPDQWYEFSVVFDRVTGEVIVYVNGKVAATWTDPSPLLDGNAVSFRNGNSSYQVDNFKVYRTRYPEVIVTVGPGTNTDAPFQNTNPATPAAKVKSIVMDNAGNLSTIAQHLVNIDWTQPKNLIINDGLGSDIDTVYSTTLEGNWGTAIDLNSGIVEYKVAIGTTSGADDIVGWTSNGINSTLSKTLQGLTIGQVYYISVKAENGAGMVATASSDGQKYLVNTLSLKENVLKEIEMFPNPTIKELKFNNLDAEAEILIYDMAGQLVLTTKVDSHNNTIDVSNFASGSYNVLIKIEQKFVVKKLIKK